MAYALCILDAPRPVAFPRRLTGSFPLNRTLSAKLISFFVTTVLEPSESTLRQNQNAEDAGFRPHCLLSLVRSTWPIISTAIGVLSSGPVISWSLSTTPRRWSCRNGLTTRTWKPRAVSANGLDCQYLLPILISSSRSLW